MQEMKVELFIPGELKEEPIIYDLIKNYDVRMKIIEASFSTESGWAYLILSGEKPEIDKMFEYLGSKGVNVEIREQ